MLGFPRWPRRLLTVGIVEVVACLAIAATASADSPSFSCRATALRVNGLGLVNVEPTVANSAGTPCASATNTNVVLPAVLGPGLSIGTMNATTTSGAAGGAAEASIADSTVAALIGGGLHANLLQASAGYTCAGGVAVPSGSSRVVGLTFLGAPVTLDQSGHAALLGVGDLYANQTFTGAGTVTHRALTVQLLPTVLGGANLVLGEATAAVSGEPCSVGGGAGGGAGAGAGGTTGHCTTVAGCFSNLPSGHNTVYSSSSTYRSDVGGFAGVRYECAIDAGGFSRCTAPFRFQLSDGFHTIRLRGTDTQGHSSVFTFHVFADTKAPTAGLLYPLCFNAKRTSQGHNLTLFCAGVARNWRTLHGRVMDPAPSSGITGVGVNLIRQVRHGCRVLTSDGRLRTMTCEAASHVFVPARLGRRTFTLTKVTGQHCGRRSRKHGSPSSTCRARLARTQVAAWSLGVPITSGSWVIRVTAVDRSGNQQTQFTGRSRLSLRLR